MTEGQIARVHARRFLVEHRLPKITGPELDMLRATLTDACARLTARGEEVRYLGSTFLPRPARLLSLFDAVDEDAVRIVAESSQAPFTYLEAAVDLPAPSAATGAADRNT